MGATTISVKGHKFYFMNRELMTIERFSNYKPEVVGTARCAVTARKAGGMVPMRSPARRFMEGSYQKPRVIIA